MLIKIVTIASQPVLEVPDNITPGEARRLVAQRFGFQQIGVPHCWGAFGVPRDGADIHQRAQRPDRH